MSWRPAAAVREPPTAQTDDEAGKRRPSTAPTPADVYSAPAETPRPPAPNSYAMTDGESATQPPWPTPSANANAASSPLPGATSHRTQLSSRTDMDQGERDHRPQP